MEKNSIEEEVLILKKEIRELKKEIQEIKNERIRDKMEIKLKLKENMKLEDEVILTGIEIKGKTEEIINRIKNKIIFSDGTLTPNYYKKSKTHFTRSGSKQNILKLSSPFNLNGNYQIVKIEDGKYLTIKTSIDYCEIQIQGSKSLISFGVINNENVNKIKHVGIEKGTIGINSDNKIYKEGECIEEEIKIKEGDIIGCGFNQQIQSVFFTRNGELIKIISSKEPMNYFAIGLEQFEKIQINNGENLFKFDLISFNEEFHQKEGKYFKSFTIHNDLFVYKIITNMYVSIFQLNQKVIQIIKKRVIENKIINIKDDVFECEELFWNEHFLEEEEINNINEVDKRIEIIGFNCGLTIRDALEKSNQIEISYTTLKQKKIEDEKRFKDLKDRRRELIKDDSRLRGGKPVILIYDNEIKAKEEVKINLKLNEAMNIGTTYPKPEITKEEKKEKEYEWKGTYSSDGINNCQINIGNKQFDYVFWEGICLKNDEFKGEVIGISNINLPNELHDLLIKLGLNERETNDFIVYWLTKLSNRTNHKVTICDSSYDYEIAPLSISGFVHIHRVMLKFEEAESIDNLATTQSIQQRNRPFGKYVIEWGAILA